MKYISRTGHGTATRRGGAGHLGPAGRIAVGGLGPRAFAQPAIDEPTFSFTFLDLLMGFGILGN